MLDLEFVQETAELGTSESTGLVRMDGFSRWKMQDLLRVSLLFEKFCEALNCILSCGTNGWTCKNPPGMNVDSDEEKEIG